MLYLLLDPDPSTHTHGSNMSTPLATTKPPVSMVTYIYPNITRPEMLSTYEMKVISSLTIITSSFSFVGAFSILFCATYRKKACMSEIFPIYQLSLADLLASSMMLVTSVLYLIDFENPLAYGYSSQSCSILTTLAKCFYVNTFLLTLSYAVEALLRMRQRSSESIAARRRDSTYQVQYFMYVMSWLLPIIVTILLICLSTLQNSEMDRYVILTSDCTRCLSIFHYNQGNCWEDVADGQHWLLAYRLLFFIPLILVMFVNMILYICVFQMYRRSNFTRGLLTHRQRHEEATIRNKAFLYLSVFLCCWIFSLIIGLIALSDPDSRYGMGRYYALFVLQALTAPLQGFCNSIIYGWKRRGFKNALLQTSPLSEQSTSYPSYNSISL